MSLMDVLRRKKRVVVIVQCRLSSTRLPRKALLPLGKRTVLEWTLAAMKKVPADKYYLAVDTDSADELEGVARRAGWDFFAGSKNDVLDRFCKVIEISRADVVIRATADNPFLFWESACGLLEEYGLRESVSPVDYITFSGLPHGSGVEMFSARSLLKAAALTQDPYDREHVGPALYNHTDVFECAFIKAPAQWNFPHLRTTIDTAFDYRRALSVVREISGEDTVREPYTYEQILRALETPSVRNPMLLIPSTRKGHGTGHLRRCLDIAVRTGADIYIPLDAGLEQTASLVTEARQRGLLDWQIARSLNDAGQYNLVVTDLFKTDTKLAERLENDCSVLAMDEGAADTDYADYLLDIIPSPQLTRPANRTEPGFITVPEKKRPAKDRPSAPHTALVVLGGEDPSALVVPAACAAAACGLYVTAVSDGRSFLAEQHVSSLPEDVRSRIKFVPPVENLREKLFNYDLVVTHYGLTAFEAAACGCAVILLGTTPLHQRLARSYGFAFLGIQSITEKSFRTLLSEPGKLYVSFTPGETSSGEGMSLPDFMLSASQGKSLLCPVCRKKTEVKDTLVFRAPERTFRRCRTCGIIYQSWTMDGGTEYDHAYFFEEYQRQYGKTYLEDFAAIKMQCVRRIGTIDMLSHRLRSPATPSVLDIGCAMGPFLDAANDAGWQAFGTDVSPHAVDYVQESLHYPAVCARFPEEGISAELGVERFDAVTMWYVIEHFEDLDSALKEVSRLTKKGGIFAFSTPSASGASARRCPGEFYGNSPADHYSLWEPERVRSVLGRYGFKVLRIVSTGIHPERLPFVRRHGFKKDGFVMGLLHLVMPVLRMGDTFEVYARKEDD